MAFRYLFETRSRYIDQKWEAVSRWHYQRAVGRTRREALRVAHELLSGRIPEQWIKKHRPFARRHSRESLGGWRYPYRELITVARISVSRTGEIEDRSYQITAPRLPINRHTGELYDSIRVMVENQGPLRARFWLRTRSQHGYVLVREGLLNMVPRRFQEVYYQRTKGLFARMVREIFDRRRS